MTGMEQVLRIYVLSQKHKVGVAFQRLGLDLQHFKILAPYASDIFVRLKCRLVEDRQAFGGWNTFLDITKPICSKLRPIRSVQNAMLFFIVNGKQQQTT